MIVIVSQACGIHILNLKQSMNENEEEEEDIAFFSKFWQSFCSSSFTPLWKFLSVIRFRLGQFQVIVFKCVCMAAARE